ARRWGPGNPACRPRRRRALPGAARASESPLHAERRQDRQPADAPLVAVAVIVDVELLVLVVGDVLHVQVDRELPRVPRPGVLRAGIELEEERLAIVTDFAAGGGKVSRVGVEGGEVDRRERIPRDQPE